MLLPCGLYLSGTTGNSGISGFLEEPGCFYSEWLIWVLTSIVIVGQSVLLCLSIDSSQKRLKRQTHIWISCAVASGLAGPLVYGAILCLGVGMHGDNFLIAGEAGVTSRVRVLIGIGFLWAVWGVAFYLYLRNKSEVVRRIMTWLLRGSVLELLVAIPCHVLGRRRYDRCAPLVTSFGITTGIAIMLLFLGLSVLLLYKKRLDE